MLRAAVSAVVIAAHVCARKPDAALLEKFRGVDWSKNRYTLPAGGPPEQIHIAYAGVSAQGYPTGMNVGWAFAEKKGCAVHYGTDASNLTQEAEAGEPKRYLDSGAYHYSVDILGLEAQTRYYYTVECDKKVSEMYSFMTAPDSYELAQPYHINIFGDMGWLGSDERPMVLDVHGLERKWSAVPVHNMQMQKLAAGEVDMMWIVGDIAYADDAFAHDVVGGLYERCMNGFVNWNQNMSAVVPYHVSVGNHESECHSPECVLDVLVGPKLANFSAYNARWSMPSKSSGGVLNMWYSWNVGPVHFVSINTETDFEGAGEESKGDSGIFPAGGFGDYIAWLEADLKQAYADKQSGKRPFIVVGGHRSCKHGCAPNSLQAMFDQYQVDLFIGGHAHKYARSVESCIYPACKLVHNATYPTSYIYSGASGSDETDYTYTGPTANSTTGSFGTSELSTGYLSIMNSTALRWRLFSAFGAERVIDQFWIHARN